MSTPQDRIDAPRATPQEREERIAELRQRRRARLRWLAIRGGVGVAALAVVAAILLYWMLSTVAGRDVLLAQIVARLPAGATLTWDEAEGPAAGPLTLRGVRFTLPRQRDPDCVPTAEASCATGTMVFTAKRVTVDAAIGALLSRTLRLDELVVEGATLDLPASDEPFRLPAWPEILPQIAPPLAVSAQDVRIDDFTLYSEGQQTIRIDRLRGGLAADDGELRLQDIVVDSDRGRFTAEGTYLPGENYRTDLLVTAVLPAADGRTPARFGLVARGHLAEMIVAVAGRAPGDVRATLALSGQEEPRWQLSADVNALDLGLLAGGIQPPAPDPIAAELQARGVGGAARLQGRFEQGALEVTVLPSELRLEDQVLVVEPLQLRLLDGTATVRGRADLSDPEQQRFRFAVNARGLTWGGADATAPAPAGNAAPAPVIVADADVGLAGTLGAWAAIGKARLTRDGETAQVRFDTRGDADSVRLQELVAEMPTGSLSATGKVAWAPALGWEIDATLAGFDPGYFLPGWDGAVNGELTSRSEARSDGGLDVRVQVPDIGGRLRGRAVDGSADFAMRGPAAAGDPAAYRGELELSLGKSRIEARGTVTNTLDIDAQFSPLQLADLLPDADGVLRGTVRLTGARTAPDVSADITGSDLRYGAYQVDSIDVDGQLPWRGSGGALAVRAAGLQVGVLLDSLSIDASGAVESLQLQAQARGDVGALELTGDANRRGDTWQGSLDSLQLAPARGAQWVLQQPADFRWSSAPAGATRISLADTCLASSAGGSLCVSADWPRNGASVQGQGLPLALAQAYLPERSDGRPWLLSGEIAIDAQLRPVGNAWRGQARVSSGSGGLKFNERARTELLRYDDLELTATFTPQRLQAELGAVLLGDGRIDARIATGWDAYAPLVGEIALNVDELTWMELLSPDIVDPQGRIEGRIGLSGTRVAPLLDGRAQLSNFNAEIPALAIALQNGNLRLDAQPDGTARVAGSVGTGGGILRVGGSLGWQGNDAPLLLNINGQDVLVSDTRDLRAVISPDVEVRYAADQPLTVTGVVGVPSARIDLERLDRGVSVSPDVVVLDPAEPEQENAATPLAMDLTLVLGEDVVLNGFGLDGTLDGRLQVVSVPGRELTASGRLEVGGEYAAYGQELEITRGVLSWYGGPVGDPLLDIRAEREIGEVTAGVAITGRASAPEAEVWSDPATTQSEALAYLTLGRPLSSVSGAEGEQLDAASAALTAGTGLLASRLGASLGLDDAGVTQSRALGGSVLGVGKFLSPRLYVSYGVSLLGTGQVLTLKYLLRQGFNLEIESSSVENRASVNWRYER